MKVINLEENIIYYLRIFYYIKVHKT